MQSEELYAQLLGLRAPWKVTSVELEMPAKVTVYVELEASADVDCPECGKACRRHDTRQRKWRHLDTMQAQTVLVADVPRGECPEHGVKQMQVPWAAPGSRFTAMFEILVIDWLKAAKGNVTAVASQLGMTWDQVDGVMSRAVERGLQRRTVESPRRLGVDETSFKRRHQYVTVVADLESHRVLHVAEGRGKAALSSYFEALTDEQRGELEAIALDMHGPFISAIRQYVPDAEAKMCFDKFHVAALLSHAVDLVRRAESRELHECGDDRLKRTRYLWLSNPTTMSDERWAGFEHLRESTLKTARAWAIKEAAMEVWTLDASAPVLLDAWRAVIAWGRRSRLAPIKRAMATLRDHLTGVIRAQQLRLTNARLEGINSIIQGLKRTARGFRNRDRFRNAIYFHLGGLDLYPKPA